MANTFQNLKIFSKIRSKKPIRVLAFGASNTQRYMTGMHWFDYVELGFKQKYSGNVGQFINSGVSGNTTEDLLYRYEHDAGDYNPELTILTIGGNDCNPDRHISAEQFRKNLLELYDRLTKQGGEVLFQTYYASDLEQMIPERATAMVRNMAIVRETAKDLKASLHDNDLRWALLREHNIKLYRTLMRDAMHVNSLGNMAIGLDLMRKFGLEPAESDLNYLAPGLFVQRVLDDFEKEFGEVE